jgi:hypothetical protein
MVRESLALVAGAAVGVMAAAVLGEYGFDSWAVVGSGVVTGLFVAEAAVAVARAGSALLAAGSGAIAAGALLSAGWIATGHRLGTVGWKGWAAVALAGAAGAVRARPTSALRHSPPAPAATE